MNIQQVQDTMAPSSRKRFVLIAWGHYCVRGQKESCKTNYQLDTFHLIQVTETEAGSSFVLSFLFALIAFHDGDVIRTFTETWQKNVHYLRKE